VYKQSQTRSFKVDRITIAFPSFTHSSSTTQVLKHLGFLSCTSWKTETTRLSRRLVHPGTQVLKRLCFLSLRKRGGGNDATSATSGTSRGPGAPAPGFSPLHKRGDGKNATCASSGTSSGPCAEAPGLFFSCIRGETTTMQLPCPLVYPRAQAFPHLGSPPAHVGRWELLVFRALRHVPEVQVLKHLDFPFPHKQGNGNGAMFAALSTSQGLGAEAPRPYLSAHAGIGRLCTFEGFVMLQSS